jgi:tetratricopeptide (TPR) repeat protein
MSMSRPDESLPLYRRSIEIRRGLLFGTEAAAGPGAYRPDSAEEFQDMSYQKTTVQYVAMMLEWKGERAEADRLRKQFETDVVAFAARLKGPDDLPRRKMLAPLFFSGGTAAADRGTRLSAMIDNRLAFTLDPENALANNDLAWALASVPDDPWFDPARGLALARKAVKLEPSKWHFLNTLGVAQYRTGNWKAAANTFKHSITMTGGSAHDLFFLAMTSWHDGKNEEAREFYKRAVVWTQQHARDNPELHRFQAEAAAMLGETCTKPDAKEHRSDKNGIASGKSEKMNEIMKTLACVVL